MRLFVLAGVVTTMCAALPVMGQIPPPFENMAQVVCESREVAIQLLAAYDQDVIRGDELLGRLAERGVCERATFTGKPVADLYRARTDKQREGHIFEVEVLKGDVLKGRSKAYMLLYMLRNDA